MAHKEAVAITINSIHRNNYVEASGYPVEWTTSLEQTGTARFRMMGPEGDWIPLVGQNFGIYDQTVAGWGDPWQLGLIFAGSIDSVTPMRPSAIHPTWLQVEVTGSSREQVLQRRLIRPFGYGFRYSRYKNMAAGAIAYAMLTEHCDGENLVLDPANFDDGPTVGFVAWNHQTCAEAMTQLANYAGCHWWVAPDSQVYFKEREAVFAPWGIVDGDNQCTALSIRESRENLSNAVFYRASFGSFTIDPLFTDEDIPNPAETVYELVADGETFFTTETQIQDVVDISVAGPAHDGFYPSTIGQADGGEEEFWFIPGDDGFSRTTGKDPLPAGTVIMIHYHRLGGDVLPFEDATAISERAAVEIVGSGRYELAAGATANTSAATAQQRASMIVQERRNTAMVVEGETKRKGLSVGQAIVISTTRPPINDTFLITSVTSTAIPGTDKIAHRFSGVNGAKLPNGWDFFTGLGDSGFGGGFGAGFQTGTDAGGGGGIQSDPLAALWRETPIGPINGTNREFYLTYTVKPPIGLWLMLNQATQDSAYNSFGGPVDGALYELIGNKITYAVAPQPGDKHEALYFKDKKVIDGPPVAATVFIITSLEVSPSYSPLLHVRAGKDPTWIYSLGAEFHPEFALLMPYTSYGEGWTERTDSGVITPMVSVADLEAMWVDCSIVGTVLGSGFTRLTVHDCWLHLTYASGGELDVRPTVLCSTAFDPTPVFSCGLLFPLLIERTFYSGVSDCADQNMRGFIIPVG